MADEDVRLPVGLTTEGLLGKRYLARFIDGFVIVALIAVAFLAVAMVKTGSGEGGVGVVVGSIATAMVIWIGYSALLESSPWQATIGKKVMGLRVYTWEGGRLSLGKAALRSVVKDGPFVILGMIPGGQIFNVLWIGAHLIVMHRSPVYQAIHDRVAKTWVAAPEATTQLRLS